MRGLRQTRHAAICLITRAEPDILRFRISLLTAAALISGITASLVGKYELEAEEARWRGNVAARRHLCGSAPHGPDSSSASECEAHEGRLRRAAKAAGEVVRDVRSVLAISEVSSVGCMLCGMSEAHCVAG